jgi:transcriptional regulator with PAS, ATPase and Fis domain
MTTSQTLLGVSPAIQLVLEDVECAAMSDVKVLVTGESGVGKEVVAGLIHRRSRRARGPFLAFNCAGVPDTLLASELFGHVRGSFTDASSDKRGYLEQANTGSIFMDEVGEMSLQMQALLLRFLESGEIQPVGSTDRRRIHVDVRVITATNRRLVDRIAAKEFRDDLFYRLNVFHIDIPPLRERRDDIPVLLEHFLRKFSEQYGVAYPSMEADVRSRLLGYDWPGNVRELRNVAERLVVRAGGTITTNALPREILGAPDPRPASTLTARSRTDERFERVVAGGESFWTAVAEPFMARDLTRDDLREIVRRGLDLTHGSYKALVARFNLPDSDYKKLLGFLRKYQAHVPVQDFKPAHAELKEAEELRNLGA